MSRRSSQTPALRPDQAAGFFYGYVIAGVASFVMVLVFTVHYAFGVFLKPVIAEFGWSRAATSGAFSLVWVTHGALALVMGGLNDRIGPRVVITVCGALIGTGFLLMSGITSIWQLYVLYGIVVGAGLGGIFVPLTSTTARWFVAKRGLITGIVTAGVGVGALIGPPIANQLITIYDWRVSYRIFGTIVLVGAVVAAQFLKRDPAAVGARPLGEEWVPIQQPRSTNMGMALGDVARTGQFWIASVVFFCYGFALSAILLHLAPDVSDHGFSAQEGANVLATLGGFSIIAKVVMGGLADRLGNKQVYLISFAMMVGALLWLTTIKEAWMFFSFAAMFGFAYGGLATAHAPLVAWLFGMRRHGLVFGASFNGWTLGCAVGPLVAGYWYDRVHDYQPAFLFCAALAAAGLLMTFLLKPVANGNQYGTPTRAV